MGTRTKTFDCVEMKNRIQAERWAEYQERRDEFESYIDFIQWRARQSPWIREMERKFGWDQ